LELKSFLDLFVGDKTTQNEDVAELLSGRSG
jgi:hypothetical protein